jgi:hypothetical protein
VSRHPAAVKWADLEAGRLPVDRATELQQHAAVCDPCARVWARVAGARVAMREVAEAAPPALHTDVVGAQIYWAASSEYRRRERSLTGDGRRGWTRRLVPVALAAGVLGAMAAVTLWATHSSHGPVYSGAAPVVPVAPVPPTPEAPAPIPVAPPALAGVVTFLQGEVTVDGVAIPSDAALAGYLVRPGARLATGNGRVAVQFGDRTGFVLEPQSSLDLSTFDAHSVELEVSGAVAVEVEKRTPDQRFVVRAGGRAVEVHGTVFRVADHGGDLDVAVTRGEVAVTDGETPVAVPAGQHVAVAKKARVAGTRTEKAALTLAVPTVPNWTTAEETAKASALVTVNAPAGARVRVQGVEAGVGSFVMRAAPGRVLVEAGGSSRWVEVEAGAMVNANLAAPNQSERPAQLDGQLRAHQRLIERCAANAAAGSLVVEIGVEADGAIGFVSPVGGDVDREVETCILDVIRDRFTFPSGTRATVQKKIRL